MHIGGRLTPEEFWARFDGLENEIRADADQLPWYGLAEWPGRLGLEWGRVDGRLVTTGLVHERGEPGDDQTPRVHVLISAEEPHDLITNRRFNVALRSPPSEETVAAAMESATSAPIGTVTISVDGRPAEFDHWIDGPDWFAARPQGDRTLVVEARHVRPEELNLVRVHDLEPYLAGRRATLRRLRGED